MFLMMALIEAVRAVPPKFAWIRNRSLAESRTPLVMKPLLIEKLILSVLWLIKSPPDFNVRVFVFRSRIVAVA